MRRQGDPSRKTLILLAILIPATAAYPQEEPKDYYKKWLNEDVIYIIAPEERTVFSQLTAPEEKDRFIEQFWLRRDADPRTSINEFKEEHYRRIAYANANFRSGLQGWRTDRGRTYITFGPPTSTERHPTGGPYFRTLGEGGGATTTYPFEVWYYRDLGEVGLGISIEFVDPTSTGEYRIALRETEKDAMFYVPGQGMTLYEYWGLETRAGRLRSSDAMRSLGLPGDSFVSEGANPFLRVEEYVKLTRPPSIEFRDLKAAVETQIRYQQLPFEMTYHVLRLSPELSLTPVTVEVAHQDLTFAPVPEAKNRQANLNLYGRVSNLGQRIVYEFEDVIRTSLTEGETPSKSLYQRYLPLKPGRYKLEVVLKNLESENIGSRQVGIVVPAIGSGELSASSIILAERIGASRVGEIYPHPFVTTGGLKVYPNVRDVFREDSPLGVYAEIYNMEIDQATSQPDVDVSYRIFDSSGRPVKEENITALAAAFQGNRISIAKLWSRLDLPPGKYRFQLSITDWISGSSIQPDTAFRVERSNNGS